MTKGQMRLTRTAIRGLSLILTVLILVYLNIKTKENLGLIAKFKYETLDTIKADSLDTEQKLSLLGNETTRFSGQILEDTSHVREGVHFLMGVIGLLIVSEFGLFVFKRRRRTDQTHDG